jgi:hypothetical protein
MLFTIYAIKIHINSEGETIDTRGNLIVCEVGIASGLEFGCCFILKNVRCVLVISKSVEILPFVGLNVSALTDYSVCVRC